MSTFEVKVRKIDVLEPHPNADRLELVVVGGYKSVVQKELHSIGNHILYIPEDSVFTDRGVAEKLGIADYLTGKYKNRVKAIRLRGILSQGICLPLSVVADYFDQENPHASRKQIELALQSVNFAETLKVEKYEEPIPIEMMGHVRPWPSFLHHYDVENIKRPESLEAMQRYKGHASPHVVFTEKLHGTNMTVALGPGLDEGERAFVCSRRMALLENDTNVYWRATRKFDLIEKLLKIKEWLSVETISLHGEVVGVQDLKYGFQNGEVGFHAFDICANGKFLSYPTFIALCTKFNVPTVPPLYIGPYDYDLLVQTAEGQTKLGDNHIREGGVVRGVDEFTDPFAGRINFKVISEAYLLRKGGTELH